MRKVEHRRTSKGESRYRVRFRYRDKETVETFTSLAAAKDFAKKLDALGPQGALEQLYADGDQAADVPTLDQVAASHFAHLTGIEEGTRKNYRRLWDRTWAPRLGHLPANVVTRDDVATAINELGELYSRKSLENQRGLLAGVIGRAVDQGLLTKNPAKGLRLPRGTEGDAVEMRIITPHELHLVLDGIAREIWDAAQHDEHDVRPPGIHPHYRPFVRFLYGVGCRYGEAIALQVQDVQLPNVRIRRAVKWSPDGDRVVGATKTKRSNRTVTVPTELHAELRELCAGKKRTDLIFTAVAGGQIHHRSFWGRVWVPAVSHLQPRPRIHDLRHSHASVLLGAGVPPHVVQRRLGHESIQTTVDTYTHLMPDAQVAAAAAAEAAFTGGRITKEQRLAAAYAALAELPAADLDELVHQLIARRRTPALEAADTVEEIVEDALVAIGGPGVRDG